MTLIAMCIYESSLRFYFYLAICVCTMHVCHQRKQCQQVGGSSSVSSYSTVLPPYLMFGVFLLFLIKILVHHLSVLMGPGFSPFTDWCEADTWTLGTDLKKESNQKRIFPPSPLLPSGNICPNFPSFVFWLDQRKNSCGSRPSTCHIIV